MTKYSQETSRGFSIIESMMVASLVSVIVSLTIVALNPIADFAGARNAKRWSDVNALLNALHGHLVNNGGGLPIGIDSTPREVCTEDANVVACTGGGKLDLSTLVGVAFPVIPVDPEGGSGLGSGYAVYVKEGRLTVMALRAEEGGTIEASL